MRKIRSGFTLIELLVVVIIIAVLAGGAIPQYFKVVERARVVEAKSMFSSVRSSQASVMAKNGRYTNNWDALDINYSDYAGNSCAGAGACAQKTFTYMLDEDGTIYATRNPVPAPSGGYGIYTLVYDMKSGVITCTQVKCIIDLL